MSLRNSLPDEPWQAQLRSMGANWQDTARQQTVHLGEGRRVIVTEDKQGRIFAARTDRHGSVVARAELNLPAPAGFDQRVPSWRVLPEETRQAVTGMLVRLFLDHCRVDRRPIQTEAVDDV
jgi:hypothetical protein